MRRAGKYMAWPLAALAAVLAAVLAAALFLLNSQAALRMAFSRFAPAGLHVSSIKGRLAGPIVLRGVSYSSKTFTAGIGSLTLDWKLMELFSLDLHITRLDVSDMVVRARGKKPETAKPPPARLPRLRLPSFFTVQLNKVEARNLQYVPAAPGMKPATEMKPFVISRLGMSALMRGSTLRIRRFRVEGPLFLPAGDRKTGALPKAPSARYAFAVWGKLTPSGGYPLSLHTQWTVAYAGLKKPKPPLSGSGAISGTAGMLHISQAINPPYDIKARFTVSGLLKGKNKKGIQWQGQATWRNLRLPPRFPQNEKQKALPGKNKKQKLQVMSPHGKIITRGNLSAFTLDMDAVLVLEKSGVGGGNKNKNFTQSRVKLESEGSSTGLHIKKFKATVLGGILRGSGKIAWKPGFFGWALALDAKGLNPGQVSPGWQGAIDASVDTRGSMAGTKRNISVDILPVRGSLRGLPVSGKGFLLVRDRDILVRRLELSYGSTSFDLSGAAKTKTKKSPVAAAPGGTVQNWDFTWRMNSKALGELIPHAGGALSARGSIRGQGIKPVVSGTMAGREMVYKAYRVHALDAAMRVDLSDRTASRLDINLTGLQAGKRRVRALTIKADGKLPSHEISINARGAGTVLGMSLKGGFGKAGPKGGPGKEKGKEKEKEKTWNGDITRMDISFVSRRQGYGAWGLSRPSPLRLSKTAALVDLCLSRKSGPGGICLKARWRKNGPAAGADIEFTASKAPLGVFRPVMHGALPVSGVLDGNARFLYAPKNKNKEPIAGHAYFRLTGGSLAYVLKGGGTVRRSLGESAISLAAAGRMMTVNLTMPFVRGGGINGRFAVLLAKGQLKMSGARVNLSMAGIPVGLFSPFMPPGLLVTGVLDGKAAILFGTYTAAKQGMTATAAIRLSRGTFVYSLKGKKLRLSFRQSTLKMESRNETVPGRQGPVVSVAASFSMPFVEGGGINGRFTVLLPPSMAQGQTRKAPVPVKGGVRLLIPNLAVMSAVLPSVRHVRGVLKADIGVSGTLPNPEVSGRLALEKVQASLPALGITAGGGITVASAGKNRFHLEGRLTSGGGYMDIKGDAVRGPAKALSLTMTVKGKNFQVVKTAEARVTASPGLFVSAGDKVATVTGEVDIPAADIKPVQARGAISPSPDVVVVSQKRKPAGGLAKWKVLADVRVVLGKKISFKGFGLESVMAGSITVKETPGKATTGQGELVIVKGTYKAYGQDLVIENGKLLYSGQPINDPGLAIRAERKISEYGVTAGIDVSGTLRQPKLVLFSEPPMDQSDALSYLVLGKPVNSASGSQGNLLYGAATSAGLAGGALLANKIGALFGIKASVEKTAPKTAAGQEQATLFLGRYLTPRLYVAYGVGIFEPSNVFRVRYRLTRNWMVQTETGTQSGGDMLYKLGWQ